MKYSRRAEIFRQVKTQYAGFLASVLWKLTGDKELFSEALQYSMLAMWKNIEKLTGKKAGAYIYRIALTANSKAWRNRIGRNGQISKAHISKANSPAEKAGTSETAYIVRRAISQLPVKQSRAIAMRYIEQQDYEAIADKLACTQAGARSHVSKAIANLKTRIIKLAVAAVIIIAIALSISILDKSVTAAYAIEQTIEAFKNVNSVYVEQMVREKGSTHESKIWARRGEDGKFYFGDFRQESVYGDITVANESENLTYYYNPSTKIVNIYKGLTVTIGSFLDFDFFLYLKEEMEDVEIDYGKDESTRKDTVLLTFKDTDRNKSLCKCGVITFDLESKLPTRFKLWDNPDFEGDPRLEITLIEYNPKMSEDTFKFKIPEDATVIKE